MNEQRRSAISILGGGAALGFAHIGALKAINQHFKINAVLGTSMGAIIGALYACGYSPEEILSIAQEKTFNKFVQVKLNVIRDGILSTKKFEDFFDQITGKKQIEECSIEYAAIAFDLREKRTVIINEGSLSAAMLASSNLPFLNQAYYYKHAYLVDGGVCHPFPLEFSNIFSCKGKKIGVNVLPHFRKDPVFLNDNKSELTFEPKNIVYNSMMVNLYNQANLALDALEHSKPDIYINCFDDNLKAWDFKKADEFYHFGYNNAKQILQNHNYQVSIREVINDAKAFMKRIKEQLNNQKNK
jgi:NTE family protein